MESESSLPYSQVPANPPYPEPSPSSPHNPHLTSWKSILILSSHLRLGLPNGLFPSDFPTRTRITYYLPYMYLILGFVNTAWWYSIYRNDVSK
jgi:hypothetical protein